MTTLYQPGIPTGTVNLDQDYINIRNNFTQLNATYLIDHVAYDVVENNGYHKALHLVPETVDPGATPGVGQLYDKTINSINNDQTLFFLTGGGKRIQLTRNFEPVAATPGSTFLPGGIIVQWGAKTGKVANFTAGEEGTGTGAEPTKVSFPLIFPSACFKVYTTLTYSAVSTVAGSIAIRNVNTAGFDWMFGGPANRYNAFQWLAIGI